MANLTLSCLEVLLCSSSSPFTTSSRRLFLIFWTAFSRTWSSSRTGAGGGLEKTGGRFFLRQTTPMFYSFFICMDMAEEKVPMQYMNTFYGPHTSEQCFGSGSGRIRIIGPDPLKETFIWIRVPNKDRDKLAYKSTKIIKIYFFKKKSLILFNIR